MTAFRLYQAFYGYVWQQMLDIYVGNRGPPHALQPNYHGFTQWYTVFIVGAYHILVMVCLLKLMISLLVNYASEADVCLL